MTRRVREARHGVHDAEDVISAFEAVQNMSETSLFGYIQKQWKLLRIARDLKPIRDKNKYICDKVEEHIKHTKLICTKRGGLEEFESNRSKEVANQSTRQALALPKNEESQEAHFRKLGHPRRPDNVVGLEREQKQLIERLTEEAQQLDVICITGMPGIGKTTLASKIFNDPAIKREFPTRIWVYVADTTKKDVFLAILRGLGISLTGDMYHANYEVLAQRVAAHLDNVKFLIVIDDVWAAEDWRKLQIVFGKSNKFGKVLITSRHAEVARITSPNRPPIVLDKLSLDESWRLLQVHVFGEPKCPPQLQVYGKLIAEHCDGLPLAVVVIGCVLAQKNSESDEMSARKNAWQKVSNSMSTYLNDGPARPMAKSISSTYIELPHHLRECFLYLGMFPEDFEIRVSKLIRMWIAERFIQQKNGLSLEETAEDYLADFIGRGLVRVTKTKSSGSVKACRIDYLVRHFCITQAGNERENFLQEVKKSSRDGTFQPPVSDLKNYHRLCISPNIVSDFISSKPRFSRVYSFVCFPTREITFEAKDNSTFFASFERLRVLDAKPIKFIKIPTSLYKLVHLRYLTLSFHAAHLPDAFSRLSDIQTLIVYTTSRTLKIQADILKMIQLRHLKTNVSATLPKTSSGGKANKLQTLGTISPESCTNELVEMACNLRKLSIRGRLASLLDGKNRSSHILWRLVNVEKLKLLNDVSPDPPSQGQLHCLPQPHRFPPKLRSLTLSATFLDWSRMSILGLLENLEVLKLKDNAFVGRTWEAADGGFYRLEVLHIIGCTDLVVWRASSEQFPKLRCLELWNCERLKEIPTGLADIQTFQVLHLRDCNKSAAASARKIHDAKQIMKHQGQTANFTGPFKLSIYDDDE